MWTGGRRAVHLGNVADFNAQFDAGPDRGRRGQWRQGHLYASLAPFYSPHPAVVVLPAPLDHAWLDLVSEPLEWDPVELHSGIAGDDVGFAEALASRPALLADLKAKGLPLLPWGRTAELDRLLGIADDAALAAVRRFESKAAALALFRERAVDHPGITVADQQRVDSRRRLTRLVTERAAVGATVVLKSEYGVGGFGTVIVAPADVAAAGGADALIRRLLTEEDLLPGHAILAESYIRPAPRMADLTFDALIAADGRVHPVGVGAMRVHQTRYQGATVGPGVVPPEVEERLVGFGTDVGRELSRHGYRGWFDIDVVRDPAGRLAPTESNLRLTGPAVAFMLRARLDATRGPGHVVRTLDQLPLGARLPEAALFDHVKKLMELCVPLDVLVLPILPGGGFEVFPSLGIALAARSGTALDAAESWIRAANAALADGFGPLLSPEATAPNVSTAPRRGSAPPATPRA